MISKEKLGRLINNCRMMLGLLSNLNVEESDNTDLSNRIREILRKLIIANMLSGRRVISITGEQGAGKSTLIKNLYNLEDGILSIREGRGEKVPVIISEHDSDENLYLVAKICSNENAGSVEEFKVTKEEFVKCSEGNDVDVVYVEVRVPLCYLGDSSSAFLLLPGYERMVAYWQELIDFSLACSDSSILVYTSSMLSGNGSREIANKVTKLLSKSAKPIFAVSFSEPIMNDLKAKNELVSNSMDIFNISSTERDRIVLIGNQGVERNKVWIEELVSSCSKYVLSTAVTSTSQKEYVHKIIHDDLSVIISELNQIISSLKLKESIENIEGEKLIRMFDIENKRTRTRLERDLNNVLKNELKDSGDIVDQMFKVNGGIHDNKFHSLGQWIFGPNAKDILKKEDVLKAIMLKDCDGGKVSRISTAFCTALNETTNSTGEIFNQFLNRFDNDQSAHDKNQLYKGNSDSSVNEQILNVFEDACTVLTAETLIRKGIEPIKSDNIRTLAKMIQWMGTYVFSKQLSLIIEDAISSKSMTSDDYEKVDIMTLGIGEIGNKSRNAVIGMLGLIGLDYIPDQKLDLPTILSEVLGVSLSAAQTVIGVTSAAIFGLEIQREMNRRQINELKSIRSALIQNYENAGEKCMEEYDEYMSNIREKLVSYIEKVYGLGRLETKIFRAQILIERIGSDFDEISEKLLPDIQQILNS